MNRGEGGVEASEGSSTTLSVAGRWQENIGELNGKDGNEVLQKEEAQGWW